MSSAENQAVFLSYASQDAEAVARIADALRAAGMEVWFDKNELRGGDAWDQKIRRQIKECALFMPVISRRTQGRREGYFRREWNLAAVVKAGGESKGLPRGGQRERLLHAWEQGRGGRPSGRIHRSIEQNP